MKSLDTFKTKSEININGIKYVFFDLNVLAKYFSFNLSKVPNSIKILLENLLRNEDGQSVNSKMIESLCKKLFDKDKLLEISFSPTRVLMQDFTVVPALADLAAMSDALKKNKIDPKNINPLTRVDLVIDHSVMVDSFGIEKSYEQNVKLEFQRNKERYEFLKWGQNSFKNLHLVPPGAGICHQVNLENISKTIWINENKIEKNYYLFPDTLVGTDSHTTMVNGCSWLGCRRYRS